MMSTYHHDCDNLDKVQFSTNLEDCNNIHDQYKFYKSLFLRISDTSFHLSCYLNYLNAKNYYLTKKKNLKTRNYFHYYSSSFDKPVLSQVGTVPMSGLDGTA